MATTLKKQEEEIEKLKKDLEKLRNKYPPEKTQKIDIGNMLFKIGEKYFDIGRFDRSLSYYNQSLEIQREILSSKDPEIAATLYIMGVAYYKRGNSKKALEFYFHCLRKHKQTLPPDHVDIAKTLHSIGKAYFYQGESDTALDYFNQALEMYKKTLPSNHADIGRVINSIGVVYDKKGQYKEALDYYKRALEIYKQTLPLNHPHIAKQLNNIGLAYFESGQLNEALDFCNQAMKICRQTLPSNHPGFTRLVSIIGREYLDERSQSKILDMLEKKKSNPDYSASKDDFHKEDELNEDFKNESAVKKPTLHSNITKTIEEIHKIQEKLSKETLTDSRLEIIDDDFLGKSFVNRYKVIKYLGGGSYGQVYLVNDMKDSNKEKAMKIMKKDETSKNELDRMKSVNHENIVKYIDDFEMIKGHNTYICIITEYCSNGNLAKKIASKKRNPTENNFTESEIFEWIFQAVKGLRYLHSNGIIHRDIKPENILLNENNVVKLCDLGIAKLTEETIHASTFAGTRPYMSPELFECSFSKNEQKYSFNTDIWSLGCVLYELMFLKKAFPKGPGTNPIVSDLDKSTQHFASILRKMLEKNPEKRISSNSLYNRLLDSELKI